MDSVVGLTRESRAGVLGGVSAGISLINDRYGKALSTVNDTTYWSWNVYIGKQAEQATENQSGNITPSVFTPVPDSRILP